jgi:hypothetical protein
MEAQIVGLGHILWNLQVVVYYRFNMGFKLHKFQTNMLWVSILLEISKVWRLSNCPRDTTFKEGTGLTGLCSLENQSSMKLMIGVLTEPLWNIFAWLQFHIMTHIMSNNRFVDVDSVCNSQFLFSKLFKKIIYSHMIHWPKGIICIIHEDK